MSWLAQVEGALKKARAETLARNADQWTLPTYYLAQGLIASWALPRGR